MTNPQLKKDLEGCGKECCGMLDEKVYGKLFKCGKSYGFGGYDDVGIEFCPTCKAKLQVWLTARKEELEFLEKLTSREFTEGEIDGNESEEIKFILDRISQLKEEIKLIEEKLK
jgi:hypothetical protein